MGNTQGIVDEMISRGQGQTSYKVRVKSFIQKMVTWTPGKFIRLKSFTVDGVKLRMKLYPNGIDQDSKGYVSVEVDNLNDFKLNLNCEFSFTIGGKKETERKTEIIKMENWPFDPNRCRGYPRLYLHTNNQSDFNKDEDVDFEFRNNSSRDKVVERDC